MKNSTTRPGAGFKGISKVGENPLPVNEGGYGKPFGKGES